MRPEYYRPLKGHIKTKFRFSINLDELENIPANKTVIKKFKAEYGERVEKFVFFPIIGKVTSRVLVIDRESEMVVDYIDINPIPR